MEVLWAASYMEKNFRKEKLGRRCSRIGGSGGQCTRLEFLDGTSWACLRFGLDNSGVEMAGVPSSLPYLKLLSLSVFF